MPFPRVIPHSDGSGVIDAVGACLGIPGITAHRAVFGDGPIDGATGALSIRIGEPLPLTAIADAHDLVSSGAHGRVLLRID